jgi:hypothetical protein
MTTTIIYAKNGDPPFFTGAMTDELMMMIYFVPTQKDKTNPTAPPSEKMRHFLHLEKEFLI